MCKCSQWLFESNIRKRYDGGMVGSWPANEKKKWKWKMFCSTSSKPNEECWYVSFGKPIGHDIWYVSWMTGQYRGDFSNIKEDILILIWVVRSLEVGGDLGFYSMYLPPGKNQSAWDTRLSTITLVALVVPTDGLKCKYVFYKIVEIIFWISYKLINFVILT